MWNMLDLQNYYIKYIYSIYIYLLQRENAKDRKDNASSAREKQRTQEAVPFDPKYKDKG